MCNWDCEIVGVKGDGEYSYGGSITTYCIVGMYCTWSE